MTNKSLKVVKFLHLVGWCPPTGVNHYWELNNTDVMIFLYNPICASCCHPLELDCDDVVCPFRVSHISSCSSLYPAGPQRWAGQPPTVFLTRVPVCSAGKLCLSAGREEHLTTVVLDLLLKVKCHTNFQRRRFVWACHWAFLVSITSSDTVDETSLWRASSGWSLISDRCC